MTTAQSMKKVTGGGLPAKAWHDFMVAAHDGLLPSPLFGTTGVQPVFDGRQHADGTGRATLSGDPNAFPEPPVGVDGSGAVQQTRPLPEGNGGMVPPADVGETTGATKRTTLFDILTGG